MNLAVYLDSLRLTSYEKDALAEAVLARQGLLEKLPPWPRFGPSSLNETFATLLTVEDADYVRGAIALGASIRAVDAERDMVIMLTPDIGVGWEPLLRHAGWTVRRVHPITEFWWGRCKGAQEHQERRWGHMMTKLHLWNLEYDRVIYLDADAVLLGPVPSTHAPLAAESGKYHSYCNAGIMILHPSVATFHKLFDGKIKDTKALAVEAARLYNLLPGAI